MPTYKKIDLEDVTELLSRATIDPTVPPTENSSSLVEKSEQFEDCFETFPGVLRMATTQR